MQDIVKWGQIALCFLKKVSAGIVDVIVLLYTAFISLVGFGVEILPIEEVGFTYVPGWAIDILLILSWLMVLGVGGARIYSMVVNANNGTKRNRKKDQGDQ